MQKILVLIISFFFTLTLALTLATIPAQAKYKAKSPSVSASVAKNRRYLAVTFANLANVKSISYQLSYNSNKGPQGAGGTIKVTSTRNLARTILFGTCSHGVCSYHTNLKNIDLSVDFNLKSGGVVSYDKKLK